MRENSEVLRDEESREDHLQRVLGLIKGAETGKTVESFRHRFLGNEHEGFRGQSHSWSV